MQAWVVDLLKPSTLITLSVIAVGGITASANIMSRLSAVEQTISDGREEREKASALVSDMRIKVELLAQQNTQMNSKLDTWLQGISRRQEQTAADVSNLLREMLRMQNRPSP